MLPNEFQNLTDSFPSSSRMPVLFIGHGHPMNALWDNDFTQALTKISTEIEKPKAILVISAHWLTNNTFVSTAGIPATIYDFGGFDDELFKIKYPAPGAPELAKTLIQSEGDNKVFADPAMGMDHGAWTVLRHIYPAADIPVFEMSIDYSKPPAFHYQMGKYISKLRDKGVLILASGNIVHNLYQVAWDNMHAKPFDWALEFDDYVRTNLHQRNDAALIDYLNGGIAAKQSVPTNDHYLPMMYALGATEKNEKVDFLFEGFQFASVSMRCFRIG